ncbi:hypothetical protein [Natronosalvus amylolyticus]|uniref:hypothetical protein n=1 Tax=Natronosalvus amylolyticus TaxID=2961994 RepID=UPI0020C9558D|nr:hypothetical protein [Natronosalvus amylolyticus]
MSRLKSAARWPFAVTRQHLGNIWAVLQTVSLGDLLPPWLRENIRDTWKWLKQQVPNVVGYRATPYEQMVASVALALVMVLASLGILTWLALVMIVPFLVGAARLNPVVDRAWPLADTNGGEPV